MISLLTLPSSFFAVLINWHDGFCQKFEYILYTQTKIAPFYCTKFVIVPVKGFRLVREMQECTAEFSK